MASPFLDIASSLLFESERLKTFFEPNDDGMLSSVKLWSSATDITPEELAMDGFYFLKKKDYCACIFCKAIVGEFEKGDTVRGKHRKHFGHQWKFLGCRFVKGEPIGNVPMSLSEHLVPLWRETILKKIKDNNKNLTVISTDFSLLDKREASFESSPFSMDMRKKLSAAGFNSCHVSDHVRCFSCGLGLRNWLDSMDPLEKHAEYSPGCLVVKLFEEPLAVKNQVDKERNSSTKIIRDSGAIGMNLQKYRKKVVDDTLVDLVIKEGDIERCVASLGYDPNDVRKAVKNRLLETGNKFYYLTECLNAATLDSQEGSDFINVDDLRTVEGINYASFRESVKALGLLNDETMWLSIKKDTVVETTGDYEKEDLEHGCSSFKNVHKLTEEKKWRSLNSL